MKEFFSRFFPVKYKVRQVTGVSRAFFIYAALLCLCVSDGVGPRLLPYPASAESPTRNQTSPGESSAPGNQRDSKESEVGRLKAQAGDTFKKLPVFSAPEISLIKLAQTCPADGNLSPPSHTPAFASLRLGRAPPQSV